jgi:hypothetical protein
VDIATAGHERPTARTVAAAAGLVLLLAAVAVTLHAGVPNEAGWRLLALIGACWAAFALAAAALLRTPRRAAVPLLLLGAVALQALAVSVPPQLTDDYFRYAWDGRVQAAGIDPYRYTPTDPALAGLRTPWLFPTGCATAGEPVCTRLNHPGSPTIYPPVAQGWFWLLHVLTRPLGPDGGGALALQLAAAALALATTVALLLILHRHGDPRTAVLWAWCPTVVLEAGNNAHVDVLAAFLLVLALGAAVAERPLVAGVGTGAAVAAKLLPLLVVPALAAFWLGRKPRWRRAGYGAAGLVGVLAAAYVPHLLAVGPRVLGFLPGYLAEEGYGGERRFALVRVVAPEALAATATVIIVLAAAALLAGKSRGEAPWRGALVLVGVTFAAIGITYPWYALLLVALVALDGRAEWLAVAAAAYPGYFTAALDLRFADTQRAGYGTALAIVLAVTCWRRTRGIRRYPRASPGRRGQFRLGTSPSPDRIGRAGRVTDP